MFVTAVLCRGACSRCTLLLTAFLFAASVVAVPQPIVRRAEATLALDAQASLVQLSGEPTKEQSQHGFLREDAGSQHSGMRTDTSAAATVVRKSLEAACRALNKLEARVDALGIGSSEPEFEVYEAALAAWRDGHPGEQPSCRVQQLSSALCRDASELADQLWSVEGGSSWDARIRKLMDHELNKTECQAFGTVPAPQSWNPAAPMPGAAATSSTGHTPGDTSELDELINDPEYEALYAQAGHRLAAVGPTQALQELRSEGQFRGTPERVEHLNGLRILRKAVGTELRFLRQILTFGGGSGDEAAMLFDLGYDGTHLIYDHPAMLLMQRLWLRYSGVPVVLGEDLEASATAVRKKIILESSLGQKIFSHVDPLQANESLFRSTTYFTQEDVTSFEKIRPVIKDFGIIQFTFQPTRSNVDASEYLSRFVEEDIAKTHNGLTWRAKKRGLGGGEVFHFLAVRKNRGPLACLKELNCMAGTLHPTIGHFGSVKMEGSDGSGSFRSSVSAVVVLALGLIASIGRA